MKTTAFALLLVAAAISPVVAGETAPAADYVPCRIHRNGNAYFPLRMLNQGILRGDATVVVEVDVDGSVTDRLVTAYTRPEFGDEALRAVKQWTFEPGMSKGKPVISILTVNFEFTVNGVVVVQRHAGELKPEDYAQVGYFPHGAGTLDRKPVLLNPISPPFPEAWRKEGRHGTVTVRFFIDESGHVRVPTVISHTDELLAGAAAAAVKAWRFEPPRVGGKPVLAYAEQEFLFERASVPETKS